MTRKKYEEYLNQIGTSLSKDEFIIGGKFRTRCYPNKYGYAIRKYDPIAFNVGLRD